MSKFDYYGDVTQIDCHDLLEDLPLETRLDWWRRCRRMAEKRKTIASVYRPATTVLGYALYEVRLCDNAFRHVTSDTWQYPSPPALTLTS